MVPILVLLLLPGTLAWPALIPSILNPSSLYNEPSAPDNAKSNFENPLEAILVQQASVSINEGVFIGASPNAVVKSGDWVTVTWHGVRWPSWNDWIGVYLIPCSDKVRGSSSYVPASADQLSTAPVKYKMAYSSFWHLLTGSGSVRFRLLNMRADYSFAFFRGGISKPTLVAVSNTVTIADISEPTMIHLALTGRPGEMRASWTSGSTGDAPSVSWGLSPDRLQWTSRANSHTYTREEMCGGPAKAVGWVEPGIFHSAVMANLMPAQRVYYQVGEAGLGLSDIHSFVTPPKVGPASEVNIFAFGDLGQAEADGSNDLNDEMHSSRLTVQRMLEDSFLDPEEQMRRGLLTLHIGDISYARGYVSQWDVFFDQIQPLAAQAPYMVSIGNHERDWPASGDIYGGWDSGGECGVPYACRFTMPLPLVNSSDGFKSFDHRTEGVGSNLGRERESTLQEGAKDTPWYAFDHGMAHVVMMSTEHDFRVGSLQYRFLEQDLSAVDRAVTPWIIFTGHRPMYIDSINDNSPDGDLPVARELQRHIEPLLVRYEVDLALWAHHHSYQRTCFVHKERCVPSGSSAHAPLHLVIGMAGAGFCTNIKKQPPSWLQYVNVKQHGHLKMSLNSSTLHFQFIGNDYGAVIDEGIIRRRVGQLKKQDAGGVRMVVP